MRRAQTIAIHRPEVVTIVGHPDQVIRVLRTAERERRLLTDPDEVARTYRRLPDGRVSARVRLMVPQPPPVPDHHPLWRGVAFGSAALAVVAAACYALAQLLLALLSHAALLGVLVALVVLAWAALSAGRRHACTGLHCAGCRDRR